MLALKVILMAAAVIAAPMQMQQPRITDICRLTHVVGSGETCKSVSVAENLPLRAITWLNPGINCAANIIEGTTLCLEWVAPSVEEESVESSSPLLAVEQKIEQLVELVSEYISPDQVLSCSDSVVVQSGDSCWSLASQASLSLAAFSSLNPAINCGSLWAGQSVCLGPAYDA